MNLFLSALLILTLLSVSLPELCLANAEENERKQTLIIGKVSNNPGKHIKHLQPIGEYAVSKLGELGINKVKIVFARDNKQMIHLIKTGQVDWVTESVYSALIFEQQASARIFLKRWKKNRDQYHSVFITRKDSGINELEQLQGKTLAFEDKGSTTGFFLPVIELMKKNIPVTHLHARQNYLLGNRVGYAFAGNELNIATWVLKGLVHAGAYSNADWESENQTPLGIKKDLKVFKKTANYPRMFELLAPHVSRTVENKLSRALLKAEFDQKGIKALQKYQHTTRFERLDKPTLDTISKARAFLPKIEALSATSQRRTKLDTPLP